MSAEHLNIVGAGTGGVSALRASTQNTQLQSLMLLSPTLLSDSDSKMLMDSYGGRLFVIVSADDTASATVALKLDSLAQGEHKLLLRAGSGSGTHLLAAQPDLAGLITQWLKQPY